MFAAFGVAVRTAMLLHRCSTAVDTARFAPASVITPSNSCSVVDTLLLYAFGIVVIVDSFTNLDV